MLVAARDRYGSEIDVEARFRDDGNQEKSSRNIAALFVESVFHNGGIIESDSLEKDDIYVDFGDETKEKICKELDQIMEEANKNGLSDKGVRSLKRGVEENKEIF